MENRRNWPWRKRSSDKHSHSVDSEASSLAPSMAPSPAHSLRVYDEQDGAKYGADPPRVSEDAVAQWQHAEERNRSLNERLAAALADITAKDNLVKQHAKVAEEAVTGWEKAEAEAAALKQQLESVQQQKLATEDRVSHLDGALKECMRQLRHVREEQETKVHESIVKKTREFEKQRSELELKLSEVGRQLIEGSAQVTAMSAALQERAKTISELGEAKSRAEAENRVLHVRLESAEKENASLKYELHVVAKEIEIRNEERDISKKSADAANKSTLESVKKIAKLEAECQRLRLLVRKRLPGPAALAQMKLEVDSLGRETGEQPRRRKSLGGRSPQSPVAPDHDLGMENGTREVEALTDRLSTLEEENTMLKEALSKRNGELQAARLMCARTASKLSNAEDQMDSLRTPNGLPPSSPSSILDHSKLMPPSRTSTVLDRASSRASNSGESATEEELNTADAWASALIAELAQFKKGGARKDNLKALGSVGSINFDLMDDFAEMERLAMAGGKDTEEVAESEAVSDKNGCAPSESNVAFNGGEKAALEEALSKRGLELQAANQLCRELSGKLTVAEEQIASLQSRNAANEKQIICLQERLDIIFEAQADGANMSQVLNEVRQAAAADSNGKGFGIVLKEGPAGTRRELGYWAHNSVFEDGGKIGTELALAVRKITYLVESLSEAIGAEHETLPQPTSSADPPSPYEVLRPSKKWTKAQLNSCILSFFAEANNLLEGKSDLTALLSGLAATLAVIVDQGVSTFEGLRSMLEKKWGNESPEADNKLVSKLEEDLRNLRLEKAALESHMRAELGRLPSLEAEVSQMKLEREDMERCLDETTENAERLKAQVLEAERLLAQREDKQVTEDELLEDELMTLSASKADILETRVKAADVEMARLHDKVAALEVELQGERMRHQEVMAKFQEIQEHLHGNGSLSDSSSRRPRDIERANQRRAEEEEAKARKDREIAAAAQQLAECQRTILMLGKQLKTLSSPHNSVEPASFESSSDSASSLEKVTNTMELLRSQAEDVQSSSGNLDSLYRDSPPRVGGASSTREKVNGTEIPWNNCHSPQGSSVSTGSYGSEADSKAGQSGSAREGHHTGPQSQYGTPRGKVPDSPGARENGHHGRGRSFGHLFTPERAPSSVPSSPSPSDSASMSSPARSPATVLPSKLRMSGPNGINLSKSLDAVDNGHDQRSGGSSGSSTFSRFYSRMRSSGSSS